MLRALGLWSSVFGCTPAGVAVGVASLELPDSWLADVQFGAPNTIGVPVTNLGTAEAEFEASIDAPFSVPAAPMFVAAGGASVIPVSVVPDRYAAIEGVLTVRSGADTIQVLVVALVDPDFDRDGHLALGADGDDCDDTDPERFPGAPERCDGHDQDCDDAIDEDPIDPGSWAPDADGDTFGDRDAALVIACAGPPGWIEEHTDCDDADPAISPAATEQWYDGIDQDCDDGDDFDRDGDGFASDAYGGTDCDDGHATTAPDAVEIWYDGVDQNCDGNDDDQDGDGAPGGTAGVDCDDLAPTTYPGSVEIDDDVDQDCDGWIDEGLWAAGVLVVTELQLDPAAVADASGRFAELYNPTTGHVDLSGVTLTVGDQSRALSPGFLGPSEVLVVCTDDDPSTNGGNPACGDVVTWPDDAGALELTGGGLTLDRVDWTGFVVPSGASLELAFDQLDPTLNDAPGAWCAATAPYGDGDLGTPGAVANPCP